MTAAVTNAAQGRGTNSNSNAIKSRPPACYMSTRSAAMMALTLGQTSGGSSNVKSSSAQQTSTPVLAQAVSSPSSSPRPTNRNVPNVASPTSSASRSKPSTPTATRAAVAAALNGGGIFSGGSNSSGSDNDGFSTSGSSTATALRRLYFKSGRSIKNKINASTSSSSATPLNGLALNPVSSAYHNSVSGCGPAMHSVGVGGGVPKLVVMGTSSASIPDTNINTSTDSASTLITNVTHTDTSETCDSLDLGDNSGPSEPLFSSLEEPLLTAIQIDSEHETGGCGSANGRRGVGTELELTSCSRYPPRPDMNLQDSTESQESCLSILTGDQSSTTPLLSSQRRQAAGGHSPGSRREERQPSTAPPPTRARDHFTFDPPLSPKSARSSEKARSHFPFKDEPRAQAQAQAQAQQTRRGYNSHNAGSTNGAAGKGVGAGTEGGIGPGGGGGRTVAASEGDEEDDERSGASAANQQARRFGPGSASLFLMTALEHTNTPEFLHRTAGAAALTRLLMKESQFLSASSKQQHQNQRQTPQQLSPSSSMSAQQRKYSSSSSSGSSERCLRELAAAPGTMFPFDREALDHERIQRECFARSSSTASASSDSDEAENRSVYERKLGADIFQQYSRLTQQEQLQQQQQQREWERDRPPSRKNSKRIRPDSVIHTTIRENQQYVPQSDAFYPQAKSSSSPSDHSYAELNKFDDIANKFEQIPPKHGSSSTLNLHMPSPGSDSGQQALSPTTDATRKRSFKSKSKNRPKGD
ncbi:GL10446 [Drosophila persimilis]|uniref:GL10446 n=1 Tax=Drosophila persimilis TaxID=7234 RepID=B4GCC7_DROPE|nr:GL10446 [Drosophila persimilis]